MVVPFLWICFVVLVNLGKCERPEELIRHQKTKYVPLGSRYLVRSNAYQENQASRNASSEHSRPLFRWDTQTEALSKSSSRGNISPVKPTIWHVRRRPKTYFTTSKATHRLNPTPHSPEHVISFRKSHVYNTVVPKETKPILSKKVIHVVSKKSRPYWRKIGQTGKTCKNPKKCYRMGERRRNQLMKINETTNSSNVKKFSNGLMADGIQDLRNSWQSRRNKQVKSRFKAAKEIDSKAYLSGLCSAKCEHICTQENSRVFCSCYSGFALVNGSKCMDVDECQINNGGCDGRCINTIGSRRCVCPDGYRLSPVNDKCLDVNECLLRNGHGPCQDTCVNTRGGYYCTCEGIRGTVLSQDNHTCKEVNECNSGATGCSHTCISVFGRSFCTCPDGYELGDDWKTCHDIDECEEMKEDCEFECVNTVGSYYCEMRNTLSRG